MDKNKSQLLVIDGGVVKTSAEGIVEGMGIVFGSAEETDQSSYHDFFTDESFIQKKSSFQVPLYFEHGLGVYDDQIGEATLTKQDDGWKATAEIDTSNELGEKIYELVKERQFGFSTGAMQHLVKRKAMDNGSNFLQKWVVGELSLTERPAERKAVVQAVKSADGEVVYEDAFMPEVKSDIVVNIYNEDDSLFWSTEAKTEAPEIKSGDKKRIEVKHTSGTVQYNIYSYDEDNEVGTDITVYEWGGVENFIDHIAQMVDKAKAAIKEADPSPEDDFEARVKKVVAEMLPAESDEVLALETELKNKTDEVAELTNRLSTMESDFVALQEKNAQLEILAGAETYINKHKKGK